MKFRLSEYLRFPKILVASPLVCILVLGSFERLGETKVTAEDISALIEAARFSRSEFFGTEAHILRPSGNARERLAALSNELPEHTGVLIELAKAEEGLGNYDAAEIALRKAVGIDPKTYEALLAFLGRRARFADEADLLNDLLRTATQDTRTELAQRLIRQAIKHDISKYNSNGFISDMVREFKGESGVYEGILDQLSQSGRPHDALDLIREVKRSSPDPRNEMLDREIELLSELDRENEIEAVYSEAFDPFWPEERSHAFYDHLSSRDRLREYGSELAGRFHQAPSDLETAIRLAHYNSYRYESTLPVIFRLEQAKKTWTSDELMIVTRFLIRQDEGEIASRFLNTLYQRGDLNIGAELRDRILYQLFELFFDAEERRLPLTKGNLEFYKDIAKTDVSPGLATGILSLIFSDAGLGREFEARENLAIRRFNQAAAYRLFIAFKTEYPTSSHLAQMHLDIVRLYTATGDLEIAERTLREFSESSLNSSDYPLAAMKLAAAFEAAGRPEDALAVCSKLLEYFHNSGNTELSATNHISYTDWGEPGIRIPKKVTAADYYTFNSQRFRDHLEKLEEPVTYREALVRTVGLLEKSSKLPEILHLLSGEIDKQPDAEWLYELRLDWLNRTNLFEEQLAQHRAALERFQSSAWRDKLARWFLRRERRSDFVQLAEQIALTTGESELVDFLAAFAGSGRFANLPDRALRHKLYESANKRFPLNEKVVLGLLDSIEDTGDEAGWRRIAAEYYVLVPKVRNRLLDRLAKTGELDTIAAAANGEGIAYKLFRADAAIRLSRFEDAVEIYRELISLYPDQKEYADTLITLTRSFGQTTADMLSESAELACKRTDSEPTNTDLRTRSGEIMAEIGNIEAALEEWTSLPDLAAGERESYLQTATLYWDYFQFTDSLQVIETARRRFADERLMAFEAGAIYEELRDIDAAISEYILALGDRKQQTRASHRLSVLITRPGMSTKIFSVYKSHLQAGKTNGTVTNELAAFFFSNGLSKDAEQTLVPAVMTSKDAKFLADALETFERNESRRGERLALKRLAQISTTPRYKIKYRLRFAASLIETGSTVDARRELLDLVKTFPTNLGVILETSDLTAQIGYREDSVRILRESLGLSKGPHLTRLAKKLSRELIHIGDLNSARHLLVEIHKNDPANLDIFRELADVLTRMRLSDDLRTAFDASILALRSTDIERRELEMGIADLRGQMIQAFSRLDDHASAISQYIELINREPENEELTDAAIAYAKRFGGSNTLLDYYQKLASAAFKNYRWNVVLARIHEANGNAENAIRNYREALVNQPEMHDLYVKIAEIEVSRGDPSAAIREIDKALELSNEDPDHIRRKIHYLRLAGRKTEAMELSVQLPANQKNIDLSKTPLSEIIEHHDTETYVSAFNRFAENPLEAQINAALITGYVNAARADEGIDGITERIFLIRDKLVEIADDTNSLNSGAARTRITILEAAAAEAVGSLVRTISTSQEVTALHEDLVGRIDSLDPESDLHGTLAFIQNLASRSDLGRVEEAVLRKRIGAAVSHLGKASALNDLIDFYKVRGAFAHALESYEEFGGSDLRISAELARLVGNREKEIAPLLRLYKSPFDKYITSHDSDIERLLELLYESDIDKLHDLTAIESSYRLQLINFLLRKGESEAVHTAIENTSFTEAWKLARHAEASIELKEFDDDAKCHFCLALRLGTIGEFIKQTPDKRGQLVGDDRAFLARKYGEWLFASQQSNEEPRKYLLAMAENMPRSSDRHAWLGKYYLRHGDPTRAAEHFSIAIELSPDNVNFLVGYGAALRVAGDLDRAEEMLKRALGDSNEKRMREFFDLMVELNLAPAARFLLLEPIIDFLRHANIEDSTDISELIHAIAFSFGENEKAKAEYFLQIIKERPTDLSLALFIINESLIEAAHADDFYERLIDRADAHVYGPDYKFMETAARTWSLEDAESAHDHATGFKPEVPEYERIKRQRAYLDILIERNDIAKAAKLIGEIESHVRGRYARPDWLRLASMQLKLRSGRFDIAEAERFIGITVNNVATGILPPDLERFNDVTKMLRHEKADKFGIEITVRFFSRGLAMGRFTSSNFVGLSTALLKMGRKTEALELLRLMVGTANDATRAESQAELASIDIIKRQMPDRTQISDSETGVEFSHSYALLAAAQMAAESGATEEAIEFRRHLLYLTPDDLQNKFELGKLLLSLGKPEEAATLFSEVENAGTASRQLRWSARLVNSGFTFFDPQKAFADAYALYHLSRFEMSVGRKASSFDLLIDALIAGHDANTEAYSDLIIFYVEAGRYHAALKMSESNRFNPTDELRRKLSYAAENVGYIELAIRFEAELVGGGDKQRIQELEKEISLRAATANVLVIDLKNTSRK